MLCIEDYLDALRWAESIGGRAELILRSRANLNTVEEWVATSDWVDFLARDPRTRSSTSICLRFSDDFSAARSVPDLHAGSRRIVELLAHEGVAYDLGSYRAAPPGFRLWGGATVMREDIAALLPWLDWAVSEL
jgi:phosphoserine aminotransferase